MIPEPPDAPAGLEEYARAEKLGDEAIRYANEIRVRAARRAGELLAAMTEKAKGGQPYQKTSTGTAKGPVENAPPRLSDLGITKKESARFQAIASIPEDEFEETLRSVPKPSEAKIAGFRLRALRRPQGRHQQQGLRPDVRARLQR